MKLVLAHLLTVGLSRDAGVTAGFDAAAPARSGLDAWALAIGYGFQLFFDFAGYSNIVIGAARLVGIRLHENFDRPYLSLTPSVFWTRWHMSLSFWIRDYVFLPLATVRRNPLWPYAAIVISMLIFGFWHGAKFTYIAWGLYHGLLLLGHRFGQRLKSRIPFKLPHFVGALLSWGATFLLVSLSYLFFRANDLGQSLQMLRAVVTPRTYAWSDVTLPHDYYLLVALMAGGYFIYAGAAELWLLWTARYRERARAALRTLQRRPTSGWVALGFAALRGEALLVEKKWWCLTPIVVLLLMITSVSFFGQSSNIAPFIYTLF